MTSGNRLRESFWDARQGPLTFFLVAYLFGLSVNLASAIPAIAAHALWFVIGVPAAIIGVILTPLFPRLWRPRGLEASSTVFKARKYKGVVVFASPGDGIGSAEAAIRYHTPQRAWCVHSDTSREAASQLKARLYSEGLLADEQMTLLHLADGEFANPEAVKQVIELRVFGQIPDQLRDDDIVIDITGGQKTTSAGAFLAGLPRGRHIEVVRASVKDDRGRAVVAGDPFEVEISYKLKRLGRP